MEENDYESKGEDGRVCKIQKKICGGGCKRSFLQTVLAESGSFLNEGAL